MPVTTQIFDPGDHGVYKPREGNVGNMKRHHESTRVTMPTRPLISKPFKTALGVAVGLSLSLAKGTATAPQRAASAPRAAAAQNEWLTWGYDQERTLWNRAETALNKD